MGSAFELESLKRELGLMVQRLVDTNSVRWHPTTDPDGRETKQIIYPSDRERGVSNVSTLTSKTYNVQDCLRSY